MATAKTKNNSTTRKMNTQEANEERINAGLERIADVAAEREQEKRNLRVSLQRFREEQEEAEGDKAALDSRLANGDEDVSTEDVVRANARLERANTLAEQCRGEGAACSQAVRALSRHRWRRRHCPCRGVPTHRVGCRDEPQDSRRQGLAPGGSGDPSLTGKWCQRLQHGRLLDAR